MDKFIGELDLRVYKPDEWVVLSPVRYGGWLIPRGFITDLASIPRVLRGAIDINDESRLPAVLHDYLYSTQPVTRAEADGFFLEALESCGVGYTHRWAMYLGVRVGGWIAWNGHAKDSRSDNFVDDSYWAQHPPAICGQ